MNEHFALLVPPLLFTPSHPFSLCVVEDGQHVTHLIDLAITTTLLPHLDVVIHYL